MYLSGAGSMEYVVGHRPIVKMLLSCSVVVRRRSYLRLEPCVGVRVRIYDVQIGADVPTWFRTGSWFRCRLAPLS